MGGSLLICRRGVALGGHARHTALPMSEPASKLELFSVASGAVREPAPLELIMTLEPGAGPVRLEWQRKVDAAPVGQANVAFEPGPFGIPGGR